MKNIYIFNPGPFSAMLVYQSVIDFFRQTTYKVLLSVILSSKMQL